MVIANTQEILTHSSSMLKDITKLSPKQKELYVKYFYIVAEFINPKYADETKTKFKSSARLECLMQDYPKLLDDCSRVGYTSVDKGFCFTTLKNDPKSAIAKYKDGLSPESAGSC